MASANTNEHYSVTRKNRIRVTVKKKIYNIPRGRELKQEPKHVYVSSVLYVLNFCYCEEKIHHVWYGGLDC